MARTMLVALALSLASILGACGGDAPAPAGTSAPPATTLDALAARFQAARAAGNDAMATSLAWSLVPTKADLAAIVAKGPAAEAFLAAFKFVDLPATDDAVRALGRQLFAPGDPKRTETKVYAATTEEIVAYARGSVAFDEFPGGMKRFAAVAAPGRTFYVVEHVEPGSDTGMKYTCFTRVDDRWLFLPKPWGSLPD